MAGVERFELPDDGVRVRSLTAWRHPNKYQSSLIIISNRFFISNCLTAFYKKNILFLCAIIHSMYKSLHKSIAEKKRLA